MSFLLPPAPSPFHYPQYDSSPFVIPDCNNINNRASVYREQVLSNIEAAMVSLVKQVVRGDKPFLIQSKVESSPAAVIVPQVPSFNFTQGSDFTQTQSFVASGGWSWKTKKNVQILPRLPNGLMYVKFGLKSQQRKFALLYFLMSKIYGMLNKSQICTLRDLYYEDVDFYGTQERLETAIYDLCHVLKVPRDALGLEATSKGLMAGSLRFKTKSGDVINLANFKSGMLIPSLSSVDDMYDIQSNANQIIVVEKDAVFQRLIDERVFEDIGPTILITGKGYPDLVTLKMIRKLRYALNLTTFAFVDCDPYGVEIASVIRWGSYKQASIAKCANDWSIAEELTVPDLVWLGLLPSEIAEMSLTSKGSSAMTARDMHKVHLVKQRILANIADPVWIQEIDVLQNSQYKAELEALFMHPKFANFYLQQKLNAYFKSIQPTMPSSQPAETGSGISYQHHINLSDSMFSFSQ